MAHDVARPDRSAGVLDDLRRRGPRTTQDGGGEVPGGRQRRLVVTSLSRLHNLLCTAPPLGILMGLGQCCSW